MTKGTRNEEYNKGYADAEKDILDKENVDVFKEGYKAGFRDGYLAAMKDISNVRLETLPDDIKDKIDDGVQPWIWPW